MKTLPSKENMKHLPLMVGAFCLFGAFTAPAASAVTYQSRVGVEFTFESSLNVSLSSADLIIDNLVPGNSADSNTITVKVTTNNANGYTLNSTVGSDTLANTGNAIYNTRKLIHTTYTSSDNTAIAADTGTKPTFSSIDYGSSLASLTADDTWGYSYSTDTGSTWSNYSGLPLYSDTEHVAKLKETTGPSVAAGDGVEFKIAAKASGVQASGEYNNVINFMVVGTPDPALEPVACAAGYICYNVNSLGPTEGTMGRQSATDGNTVKLFASNFSRDGYGFAGWSDAYDYATNANANFYGPNEDITVPTGTTANGLSLYAVWVKSAGSMQQNAASVCNTLTPATYNNEGDSDESTWSITANLKNSITALTDDRDGDTYAIARLSDGKCWMIENLRLADTHQEGANTVPTTLTTTNTNNPLNDGNATNPTVTLKHNYADTDTHTNLSATSSVLYNADTAPSGWCTTDSAECYDQSRLRTDNTANRVSYSTTQTMSTDANLYSYGNYYNWYSATAGNGTYSKSSGTTAGDLCPYGWHLPTGTGSGEFGLLSNSLGGYKNASDIAQYMSSSTTPTSTIMDKRLRHFPNNFVNSGYVSGASLSNRGSYGDYWTSTASSSNSTYYLYFGSSNVSPGTSNIGKYYGWAVRCVVAPGA